MFARERNQLYEPASLVNKSRTAMIMEEGTVLVIDNTQDELAVKPSTGTPGETFFGIAAIPSKLTNYFPVVRRIRLPNNFYFMGCRTANPNSFPELNKAIATNQELRQELSAAGFVQMNGPDSFRINMLDNPGNFRWNPELELHTNYILNTLMVKRIQDPDSTEQTEYIQPGQGRWEFKHAYLQRIADAGLNPSAIHISQVWDTEELNTDFTTGNQYKSDRLQSWDKKQTNSLIEQRKILRTVVFDVCSQNRLFNPGDIIELVYSISPTLQDIFDSAKTSEPGHYDFSGLHAILNQDSRIPVYRRGIFFLSNFESGYDYQVGDPLALGKNGRFIKGTESNRIRGAQVVVVPRINQFLLGIELRLS